MGNSKEPIDRRKMEKQASRGWESLSPFRNQRAEPEVKTHRTHSACFNEEEMNIGLDHISTSWRKRSLYQVTPAGFDLPADNQPVLSSVAGAAGGVSALSFLRLARGVKYGSCTDTDTQSRHRAGTVTPTSPPPERWLLKQKRSKDTRFSSLTAVWPRPSSAMCF